MVDAQPDQITSFMSRFGNEPYTFAINYTSKYAQAQPHTTDFWQMRVLICQNHASLKIQ